jgi:hypothetical protein
LISRQSFKQNSTLCRARYVRSDSRPDPTLAHKPPTTNGTRRRHASSYTLTYIHHLPTSSRRTLVPDSTTPKLNDFNATRYSNKPRYVPSLLTHHVRTNPKLALLTHATGYNESPARIINALTPSPHTRCGERTRATATTSRFRIQLHLSASQAATTRRGSSHTDQAAVIVTTSRAYRSNRSNSRFVPIKIQSFHA